MQINAMSTIIAINQESVHSCLLSLIVDSSHASPLPRVFNGVDENDVVSGYVEAAVMRIRCTRVLAWSVAAEYARAVGRPELGVDVHASQGIGEVGDLVEPEFGAVLVRPLSADAGGGQRGVRKHVRVVVRPRDALLGAVLVGRLQLRYHVFR